MEKITRESAIALKKPTYFTGNPCKHGHVAPRSVYNRGCTKCALANVKRRYSTDSNFADETKRRASEWVKANPEKYRARLRKWREQNKEKAKEGVRNWHAANKEHVKKYKEEKRKQNPNAEKEIHKRRYADPTYAEKARRRSKEWRALNPGRNQKIIKEWCLNNPERAKIIRTAGYANRRARQHAAGKISADDISAIRDAKICAACGIVHPRMEIDHIEPLSRGGTNQRNNLQLLCEPCNRNKSAKDPVAWLAERLTRPQNSLQHSD